MELKKLREAMDIVRDYINEMVTDEERIKNKSVKAQFYHLCMANSELKLVIDIETGVFKVPNPPEPKGYTRDHCDKCMNFKDECECL